MIAGYCWPQSGVAGDVVALHMSSDAGSVEVSVVRVGASEVQVASYTAAAAPQPVPDDAAIVGCGWEPSLDIQIDPSWRTGFHLVRMTADDGEVAEAFFVVRATTPGDALLVLSTSTYAAYNDWGGPSFYTGGQRSSQQRPLPRGFLDKPDPHRNRVARVHEMERDEARAYFGNYSLWSCASGWANWERLFVAWAEGAGLQLDYATSLDLAADPDLLTPYSLYLSVGHDEYWSASMRDAVEGWVDRGGFAAFFSGNTSFWQVRFEGEDRHQVVGYKMAFERDPVMGTPAEASVSTMWSDPLVGRPEAEMTGVTFTRGGYAHTRNAPQGSGGYTVWRPQHWAFDGIELHAGDIVGAEPVVVGYECDGCELALDNGLPVAVGSAGTPQNFDVLGTAAARLWLTEEVPGALDDSYVGEVNWVAERLAGADTEDNRAIYAHGAAVMGHFRRGAGEVFTVGCTDWAYGLDDPQIDRITRNVIGRRIDMERQA